jgi:hypothetical protein
MCSNKNLPSLIKSLHLQYWNGLNIIPQIMTLLMSFLELGEEEVGLE